MKNITPARLYHAKAKYIPQPDGTLKLAMIQSFNRPVFNPDQIEIEKDVHKEDVEIYGKSTAEEKIRRATRRAKLAAFDKILCNPDLNTFATFTLDPERVVDACSYEECYEVLRRWLSNRVQRKALKYVIVPERHKKGGLHFHAIMNQNALQLERAHSAKTGRALSHCGNPLYNVTDWKHGFTSAEIINDSALDREKVAKYIFKYMGKQQVGSYAEEAKIGGRYFLSGGDFVLPVYDYAEAPEAFNPPEPVYTREIETPGGGVYREFSFI